MLGHVIERNRIMGQNRSALAEVELKDLTGKVVAQVICEMHMIEGIEIACHKTPGKSAWQATEPRTGRALTRGHVSQDSVIAASESIIRRHGPQAVLDLIERTAH
jgi:hypothetical protein